MEKFYPEFFFKGLFVGEKPVKKLIVKLNKILGKVESVLCYLSIPGEVCVNPTLKSNPQPLLTMNHPQIALFKISF